MGQKKKLCSYISKLLVTLLLHLLIATLTLSQCHEKKFLVDHTWGYETYFRRTHSLETIFFCLPKCLFAVFYVLLRMHDHATVGIRNFFCPIHFYNMNFQKWYVYKKVKNEYIQKCQESFFFSSQSMSMITASI